MDTIYYVIFIAGAIALVFCLYLFSWRKKPTTIKARRPSETIIAATENKPEDSKVAQSQARLEGLQAIIAQEKENLEQLEAAAIAEAEVETIAAMPTVEVRTYDISTRTVYNETIPGETVGKTRETHGNLGRKWLYEGRWVYALKKDEEGDYSPVIIPVTMENPPSRLHRALTHPQVGIVYNVEPAKNLLQKYGHILLFAGVCAFLMFMLVAQ